MAEPDKAEVPIRVLLAAGALSIPTDSTCSGNLPDTPELTLGALLASRLTYFASGENRIAGQCDNVMNCSVAITHADGEDVQSADFRFRLENGHLQADSLQCIFTP